MITIRSITEHKMLFIWVCTVFFLNPMSVLGESFHHIDATSLYGQRVNDLLEDNEGYMWIGTNKGLYRFDGQQIINITDIISSSLFKTNNLQINSIQEDAGHHLWVNNSSTYIVLDAQRKTVDMANYLSDFGIRFKKNSIIHIDRQGDIWNLTQDSLFHYCFRDRTLRGFPHSLYLSAEDRSLSVSGSHGVFYIIKDNYLYTFVEQNVTWTIEELPFELPQLGNILSLLKFRGFIDSNDVLWITSFFSEDIIYRHHGQKEWHSIELPSNDEKKRNTNGRYYNSIRHLAEDDNGGIWIATDHRGLFHYSQSTGITRQFTHNSDDFNSIASNNVLKVLVDRHGTLWVGYFKVGLSYCHSNLAVIKHRNVPNGDVTALLTDNNGDRWIGTEGHGLWRQNKTEKVYKVPDIPDIVISDLQLDQNGNVWVATYDQGLYVVDHNNGCTHHYTASSGLLPHDGASRICIDGEGGVWVCSSMGTIYRFDTRKHISQTYFFDDNSAICGEAICYDQRDDKVFAGTFRNVWVHDNKKDSSYILTNISDGRQLKTDLRVSNLLPSSYSPLIWMSHSSGLLALDTQTGTLYTLNAKDYSLLPNNIQSICEDSAHRLWVAGMTTIAIVQPQKDKCGNFDFGVKSLSIGKQTSGHIYNIHAAASEPWGTMVLGNTDGYMEFAGQSLLAFASEPDLPKISTVQLGDSIVSLSPLSSDNLPLVLSHDHLPLVIHFYSGNLLNVSGVNYTYRIKGLSSLVDSHDGWCETPLNNMTIHSLPPGEYTLELRMMGFDGEWSPSSSLPIIVNHPWWNTKLMRMVYLLSAILLVVFAVWLTRRQQIKRMEKEREDLIREHESRITQLTIAPIDDQFMGRLIDIVDEHLADPDFGVEALAADANVSRSLLYKKLMSLTGQSPISFIRRLRMKRAAFMLENSQLQVTEIAYQVGYNTIKTFTENFKQVYGVSPSDYRKKKSAE